MQFSHDGDFGDTLAAMSLMHDLGGGDLVLFPTNTRERMSPARVSVIGPLLEAQSYVNSVRFAPLPSPDGLNLGHWRHHYRNGLNLVDMYYEWIGKKHPDRHRPWLEVEPDCRAEVVFARTFRYHGSFSWRRAAKKYRGHCLFLGLPDEHRVFQREYGNIPYHQTTTLLDAARIIQGAKLVCVNQTALYWIAEGLKRPVCLEAAADHGLRNCHWARAGFFYSESEYNELPDLDVLDELNTELAEKVRQADGGNSESLRTPAGNGMV